MNSQKIEEEAKQYLSSVSIQHHDLVNGWKIGKAYQLYKMLREHVKVSKQDEQLDRINYEIQNLKQKFDKLQMSSQTSLSKNVFDLIVYRPQKLDDNVSYRTYLNDQKLLIFDEFTKKKLLEGLKNEKDEDEMYRVAGRKIQKIIQVLDEQYFSKLDRNTFKQHYSSFFNVIHQPELFEISFEYHQRGDSWIAFVMLVPFIERALLNLLYAHKYKSLTPKQLLKKNAKQLIEVPGKLKDLLQEKEIIQMVGEDLTFLLSTFIGPLHSLNLRNVTLHGFISESEFYRGYTSFLFLLMLSLDPIFKQIRLLYDLPNVCCPLEDVSGDFGFGKEAVFIGDCNEENIWNEMMVGIDEVLCRSLMVLPTFRETWKKAIKEYSHSNYYTCLMYLFPLLEHSLRRIYVCVNECWGRLLTAEQHSLFTTLDILLADVLLCHDKSKVKNKIHDELGLIYQNALFDWFIWDMQLRLRDIMAHGACNVFQIQKHVTERVLSLALALIVKYDVDNIGTNHYFENLPIIFKQSINFYEKKYEPVFHPKNMLKRDLERGIQQIEDTQSFFKKILELETPPKIEESEKIDLSLIKSTEEYLQKCLEKALVKKSKIKQTNHLYFPVIMTEKEFKKVWDEIPN